jgi:hypothetical protein
MKPRRFHRRKRRLHGLRSGSSSRSLREQLSNALALEPLEDRRVLAQVQWDGGGDGFRWLDPLNWSNDTLPAATDDAVVLGANLNLVVDGNVRINDLLVEGSLTLDVQATLTLTGSGELQGELLAQPGTSLVVDGVGASFASHGDATIDGASVAALNGGTASLNGVTGYRHASTGSSQHRSLRALGAGSRLELPNLTGLTGGTHYDSYVLLQADDGGVIDLPVLEQLYDPVDGDTRYRRIDVVAQGADSLIAMPELVHFSDRSSTDFGNGMYSSIRVSGGAEVQIPQLTEATGINLELDGTATIATSQLERLVNSRIAITGGNRSFAALQDASDTDFVIVGADVAVPLLTDIDSASIRIEGGVTFALPNVTSYDHASIGNSQHRLLRASGAGSRLELPNLIGITGGTHYNSYVLLHADDGGVIDLPLLEQIYDPVDGDTRYRRIDVLAQGEGSLIAMPELVHFSDRSSYDFGDGMYSSIKVSGGAEVQIPQLTEATGINLELDGTATIATSQWERLVNGRIAITGGNRSFAALQDASDTDFVIVGADVAVPLLTDIDSASIRIEGGVTFALPNVTSYDHASIGNSQHRLLRASGAGSRLELPNLIGITGGTHYNSYVLLQADDGGVIDLPVLEQLYDPVDGDTRYRRIDVVAQGADSLIAMPELVHFSDRFSTDFGNGMYSSIKVSGGAEVQIPQLTEATGINLELDGTATIATSQWERLVNGRVAITGGDRSFLGLQDANDTDLVITGAAVDLPLLESLRYGSITLTEMGMANVPLLSDIDGASLRVEGGVTLALPNVSGYDHASTGNSQHRSLRALGAGSRLELPNLIGIAGGTHYDSYVLLQADDGGVIDLPVLEQLYDPVDGDTRYRRIDVVARGEGSLIAMPELVHFSDRFSTDFGNGMYSSIKVSGGAEVQIPQLTEATGINLELDGTATIATSQWERLVNGRVAITGGDRSFAALRDTANTDFVITGAAIDLPLLESLRYGSITLTQMGTTNVPLLADIDGTSLRVEGGVTLALPNVTSYDHASTGNSQHRSLRALGAGSRLELPNLTGITGGTHYDSYVLLQADDGGAIDLPVLEQLYDPVDGDTRYRRIDVIAQGADSLIAMPELVHFSDRFSTDFGNGMYSSIKVSGGAEVQIPQLTEATGINLELDGTATIATSQWERLVNGRVAITGGDRSFAALRDASDTDLVITGAAIDLPLLESLRYGSITLADMGTANVPTLSDIDGASLRVEGGVTLALPNVTSYDHASTGNSQHRSLRALGAGSRLELPNLIGIAGGTHYDSYVLLQADDGGVIDLPLLEQIYDPIDGDTRYRRIDVIAQGEGSLASLPILQSFIDRAGFDLQSSALASQIRAASGGMVNVPADVLLFGVITTLPATTTSTDFDEPVLTQDVTGFVPLSTELVATVQDLSQASNHWIGGQSGDWNVAGNWSSGSVPSSSSRVTINNSSGPVSITIPGGNAEVLSLDLDGSLTIQPGASLRVREASAVSETIILRPGATLIADGSEASFAHASAEIDGANLIARNGGRIVFPSVTSYSHGSTGNSQHRTIRAEGIGSEIDLSQVTHITGGTHYNSYLRVEARDGGRVKFNAVEQITDPAEGDTRYRRIDVIADGPGSRVDLDALHTVTDTSGYDFGDGMYSTIAARNSGQIHAPLLATLQGVNLELDQLDRLPIAQITSAVHSRIQLIGDHIWQFTGLTTLENTSVVLRGGIAEFSAVATLHGVSLFAKRNSVIRFPSVTSYSHGSTGNSQHRTIRAEGIGSEIDLSQVTHITGGTHYNSYLRVEARDGGRVKFNAVEQITDPAEGDTRYRRIDVIADGPGSRVELDALHTVTDTSGYDFANGMYSTIAARNGGQVNAPLLATLQGVNLELDQLDRLPIAQITSAVHSRIVLTGDHTWQFTNLTTAENTDIVLRGGPHPVPCAHRPSARQSNPGTRCASRGRCRDQH